MITDQEYTQAIKKLIPIAAGDTGGGRVAAQVLLSAYSGLDFQLNIVDLCNLDSRNYHAALAVIRGRVELGLEPHNLIQNGDQIFGDLWEQWFRYHVKNRGCPTCTHCRGAGSVYVNPDDDENYDKKICPKCGGNGFIC